jgi:hypothetical protein
VDAPPAPVADEAAASSTAEPTSTPTAEPSAAASPTEPVPDEPAPTAATSAVRAKGRGRKGRRSTEDAAPWLQPLDGAASLGPAAARAPVDPFAPVDGDEDVLGALASLGAIPAVPPQVEEHEPGAAPARPGKGSWFEPPDEPAVPNGDTAVQGDGDTPTGTVAAPAGGADGAGAAVVAGEDAAATPGSWFEPPEERAEEPPATAATPLLEVLGPSGAGADLIADPLAPESPSTGMVPLVPGGATAAGLGLGGAAALATPEPRLSRRARRRAGRPRVRRVTRVVRHVDAWSVFKVSIVFFVTMYLILLVAGVLLWSLAISTGTIDNAENFITELFALDSFSFNGQQIFEASLFGGGVLVVAGTGATVTLAVLFNLISDMMGGVRITVLEQEPPRRARPVAPGGPADPR